MERLLMHIKPKDSPVHHVFAQHTLQGAHQTTKREKLNNLVEAKFTLCSVYFPTKPCIVHGAPLPGSTKDNVQKKQLV